MRLIANLRAPLDAAAAVILGVARELLLVSGSTRDISRSFIRFTLGVDGGLNC